MRRRRQPDSLDEARAEWSRRWKRCWRCGLTDYWTPRHQTHEIIRRSETADWRDERNYSRLCPTCHAEAHGGELTKGQLMTLKLILDPGHADIEWLRRCAIRRGIECEPLPRACDWLLSDAAITERSLP